MLYIDRLEVFDRDMRIVIAAAALLLSASAFAQLPAGEPPTPASVVAAAPAAAWRDIPASDLLVMMLPGGRTVVIQLASGFSQPHVTNIRRLAEAHWWDASSIYRVQDNYVAQWGDVTEKKPLPPGVRSDLAEVYDVPARNVPAMVKMPYRDAYADAVGFLDGWPVASDGARIWLPHCYAMVGVARNLKPDAGTGAELYAVIGHAPRQLDRNIAVVGRVIAGMEHLGSLPRGRREMGFYTGDQPPTPILSVRLASGLPPAERPRFQMMDVASRSFADYVRLRANRSDAFYTVPAGGADICNLPVPVRRSP